MGASETCPAFPAVHALHKQQSFTPASRVGCVQEPADYPDKRGQLIRDFEHYLGILKAVHSGADLQASAKAAGHCLPSGAKGHLGYVLASLGSNQAPPPLPCPLLCPCSHGFCCLMLLWMSSCGITCIQSSWRRMRCSWSANACAQMHSFWQDPPAAAAMHARAVCGPCRAPGLRHHGRLPLRRLRSHIPSAVCAVAQGVS